MSERPDAISAEHADRVPDIVIITGMSGSGRTQAMHVFEDMGYFCIDNLPPSLIMQLAEIIGINTGVGRHLCVTSDLRSQGLFDELLDTIETLRDHEMTCKVLFLEASDEVLIRRYSENRRRHPLAKRGDTMADAIQRERMALASIRERADLVIDTSRMRTATLRRRLQTAFSELSDEQLMDVHVFSFGFKHGLPVEADLMIDVRFLPNPFYVPEYKYSTGRVKEVADYIERAPVTREFLGKLYDFMDFMVDHFKKAGKTQFTIAIGCTGGMHRSVFVTERLGSHLKEKFGHVNVEHRDLHRNHIEHDVTDSSEG